MPRLFEDLALARLDGPFPRLVLDDWGTHTLTDQQGFDLLEIFEELLESDGGLVSSDAGALLLGETDNAIRLVDRFDACFRDGRHPAYVLHEVKTLVAQRVFGLTLGYEDLVDHNELRRDPVLGVLLGKLDRGLRRRRRLPARAR